MNVIWRLLFRSKAFAQQLFVGWFVFLFLLCISCVQKNEKNPKPQSSKNIEDSNSAFIITKPDSIKTPKGMVWISGGIFRQGAVEGDTLSMPHEKPAHKVKVAGFFMDVHEVTNAQFSQFVKETGYLTVAERKVDWEELKKQLPAHTPKPEQSLLQPGSLVFRKDVTSIIDLNDYSQWWNWTTGANWKHPYGPDSDIQGLENQPVVHIAYEDAIAYCNWSGRRLPTEAEWEYAARAKKENQVYYWGNDYAQLSQHANTWEGDFPSFNTEKDGFGLRAPVGSFTPNAFGLYDMSGNVWEWTSDWYHANYYQQLFEKGEVLNPKGPKNAHNPTNPRAQERVIKGGSFLCSSSYCANFRISSRMATTEDSSLEHLGFRTVLSLDMLD